MTASLNLYGFFTRYGTPALDLALSLRAARGKELPGRMMERKGISTRARPDGQIIWLHAASVGETQSALILIARLSEQYPAAHFLVTTGTVTAADLISRRAMPRVIHQFAPWDHPGWVESFLNHWHPDMALWMESELWPNMLAVLNKRGIPAALINARLSDKSFARWKKFPGTSKKILAPFSLVLCQTDQDAARFKVLGAQSVHITDNLKYSARPLPCDERTLRDLEGHMRGRPSWLFASTHKGEEIMALRVHERLKATIPDILTIIAPRHIERRAEIHRTLSESNLVVSFRGERKNPPAPDADIYIADTMGELGLFYRLSPIACIGRSFSDDGGGGHNPIEAAQLRCVPLYGPHVQYQQSIYDEMSAAGAAHGVADEGALAGMIAGLLTDKSDLTKKQNAAYEYARSKAAVIDRVMAHLDEILKQAIQP